MLFSCKPNLTFFQTIKSEVRKERGNAHPISSFLKWHAQNPNFSDEQFIDRMIRSCRVDVEREQIHHLLNELENPLPKHGLILEMTASVEDQELVDLLAPGLERFKEEEEDQNLLQNQEILEKTYKGKFPYWALQLLMQNQWERHLVHFLPLVISDPEFPSPQNVGAFLRGVSYQILFHDVARPLEIKVYDRYEMDYKDKMITVEPFCDDNNLFSVEENADTLIRRRDFLLERLIGNEDRAKMYRNQVDDVPVDMQLILAVTICWMDKTTPNEAMQRALAITLTLLQLVEENPDLRDSPSVGNILGKVRMNADAQFLQWISEWEVILDEAFSLNQLLEHPLPEPKIGKIMSAGVLENIFCGERIERELMKIALFSNRFNVVSALLFQ